MKTLFFLTIFSVFMFYCKNEIQAQNTQIKLNQVEWMKQFLGSWKAEIGKDTAFIMECNSFYNGSDFYLKRESKGKIIFEQKTLMGYDKNSDKIIECAINNSSKQIILMAAWFTSVNKCEEVLFKDIANPDIAKNKWIFEFKSPDLLTWTDLVNNKPTNIYTFHREK